MAGFFDFFSKNKNHSKDSIRIRSQRNP